MSKLNIPQQLQQIAEKVGQGQRPTATVRDLLSWFWGYQRRGSFINAAIRRALAQLNLETIPDFDEIYLDGPIAFLRRIEAQHETISKPTEPEKLSVTVRDGQILADAVLVRLRVDPTHRVARLKSAHTQPVAIAPDATIEKATTIMIEKGFSQLPVMTTERVVKGLFSWNSLASRLSQGQRPQFVRESMDPHHEIKMAVSLLDAIEEIVKYECVLVRDESDKISGIITTSDLSIEFHSLSEPFLLLEEIEKHIRDLIADRFSQQELCSVRVIVEDSREVKTEADLTLGEFKRLLEKPDNWERLGILVDRSEFCERLEEARKTRNDVMHFDTDPISPERLADLRSFTGFLRRIQQIRVRNQP
ncbi:MAG TPA: CBS domain-containing protein [Candidatus Dormibacteraeota bacterium]|nr:CBS domain-containing protein [Candidatus Dormibacteraeota bacterium]